jgi:hypothetical protein
MTWGTAEEQEKRKRIFLSIAAYAYEIMGESLLSDADYDTLALSVDLTQGTGNEEADQWFRTNFNASTGMWVRAHPHQDRLKALAEWILAGDITAGA